MSSNKHIRELMERKYGKICFMEELGIRYIPIEERRKLKGYKKTDEVITYHHLKPRCKNGPTTEENGALLKNYNHMWLEQQSPSTRERINERMRRFKAQFVGIEITGDMRVGNQIIMDLDDIGKYIEIPVYRTEEKNEREDEILR